MKLFVAYQVKNDLKKTWLIIFKKASLKWFQKATKSLIIY